MGDKIPSTDSPGQILQDRFSRTDENGQQLSTLVTRRDAAEEESSQGGWCRSTSVGRLCRTAYGRIVPYFVSDVFCERYNYGVVICCGNSSLLHLLFSDTGNGHSTLYKVDPYTFRGLRDWILDVRCLLFWALYIDLQLSRLR